MEKETILITGASSGIGKACAEKFASEGYQLVLVARNKKRLEELAKNLPGNHLTVPFDLMDVENIKNIFESVLQNGWKLDGLIYSAGMDAMCPMKVNSINLMRNAMTLNCFAFCEMGKWFYSAKYSNSGSSIIAISSIASQLCEPGQGAYSASKAALNAVVKTMSKEYVRRKIRVNAILPAGVNTSMAKDKVAMMEEVVSEKTHHAVQVLGDITPEAVANSVFFFASNSSAYITGELLTMGAGYWY